MNNKYLSERQLYCFLHACWHAHACTYALTKANSESYIIVRVRVCTCTCVCVFVYEYLCSCAVACVDMSAFAKRVRHARRVCLYNSSN